MRVLDNGTADRLHAANGLESRRRSYAGIVRVQPRDGLQLFGVFVLGDHYLTGAVHGHVLRSYLHGDHKTGKR